MPVTISASIREPRVTHQTTDGLATDSLTGTGADYMSAPADMYSQVPEGWQVLGLMTVD